MSALLNVVCWLPLVYGSMALAVESPNHPGLVLLAACTWVGLLVSVRTLDRGDHR